MFKKRLTKLFVSFMAVMSLTASSLPVSAEAFSDGMTAEAEETMGVFGDVEAEVFVPAEEPAVEEVTELIVEEPVMEEPVAEEPAVEVVETEELFTDVEVTDLFTSSEEADVEVMEFEAEGIKTYADGVITKADLGEYLCWDFAVDENIELTFIPEESAKYYFELYADGMGDLECPMLDIYDEDMQLIASADGDSVTVGLEAGQEYTLVLSWGDDVEEGVGSYELYIEQLIPRFEVSETQILVPGSEYYKTLRVDPEVYDEYAELSYTWYKKNASTGEYELIEDVDKKSYSFDGIANSREEYRCDVTDGIDVVEVYFTVIPKEFTLVDEDTMSYVNNITAKDGETVRLTGPEIASNPYNHEIEYIWIEDSEDGLEEVAYGQEFAIVSENNEFKYYSCRIQDEVGNYVSVDYLINGATFDREKTKVNVTGKVGEKVTLTAYLNQRNAGGYPEYVWWGKDIWELYDCTVAEDRQSSSITVEVTDAAKEYRCEMFCGSCGDTITVTVSPSNATVQKLKAPNLVSAEATAYNKIKLTWDKVSGADGYRVYRKTEGSSEWKVLIDVNSSRNSVVNTVSSGVQYTYTVKAFKNSASGKVLGYCKANGINAMTKAKAPGVSATATAYNKIKVTWDKVSGADGYRVYKKTEGSTGWKVLIDVPASRNSVVNTVSSGVKCTYTVKAYNLSPAGEKRLGYCKANGASAITKAQAPALKPVTSLGNKRVRVEWNAVAGVDGYRVYRRTKGSTSWKVLIDVPANRLSVVNTLSAAGSYDYTVKAYIISASTGEKLLGYCSKNGVPVTVK